MEHDLDREVAFVGQRVKQKICVALTLSSVIPLLILTYAIYTNVLPAWIPSRGYRDLLWFRGAGDLHWAPHGGGCLRGVGPRERGGPDGGDGHGGGARGEHQRRPARRGGNADELVLAHAGDDRGPSGRDQPVRPAAGGAPTRSSSSRTRASRNSPSRTTSPVSTTGGSSPSASRKRPPAPAASNHPLSVVLLDLDGFKRINDELGHGAGDDTLRVMADLLLKYSRGINVICRWGGDEFAVLPGGERPRRGPSSTPSACARSSPLIRSHTGARSRPASASPRSPGHVARQRRGHLSTPPSEALYSAKRSGKNRVCMFEDIAAAPHRGRGRTRLSRPAIPAGVLIVDDDRHIRDILRELFLSSRCDARVARRRPGGARGLSTPTGRR